MSTIHSPGSHTDSGAESPTDRANRIASRANRIAVTALITSTLISAGALAVSAWQAEQSVIAHDQVIAEKVIRDGDVHVGNKEIFKFGNHSTLPVSNFHADFRTVTGETRNYTLGTLDGCTSLGLYVDRTSEILVDFSFTDPYGLSWSRDKDGHLTEIEHIDTTSEKSAYQLDLTNLSSPSADYTSFAANC
jgi:hypothetical protein